MTDADRTYVIVGGGLAGAKAAETLRAEGFAGRVVLFGEETVRPYERPPLSKGYLLGKEGLDKVFVHGEEWYADNDVDLQLARAVDSIDLDGKEVSAGGTRVGFDKLLLVTGSVPRRLDVDGADLEGVLYLRRLGDSEAIRGAIAGGGKRVVVVGAGWIGLETAAAARMYGNYVTIVEPQPTPLYAVLGPEMGEVFAALHREHDVDLRLGEGVGSLIGLDGHVASAMTSHGEELPADIVIVGVGIRPLVDLGQAAGLEVDNGILTDQALRTSHRDVFAAGDVASSYNPLFGRRLRVEHWANALNGGPAAARSMLGQDETYDRVPYFYSDQYDLGMEYSGFAMPGDYDEVVVRGDAAEREFVAFWLAKGRVLAGMNVNVWDVNEAIQALVRSGAVVDRKRLADPDVPLEELVG